MFDQTLESAKQDFQEYFEFLYFDYGLEDDSKLTKKARELKQSILNIIKKVYQK